MDRRQALATGIALALSGGTVTVAMAATGAIPMFGLGGPAEAGAVAPSTSGQPPVEPVVVTSIVYVDDVVALPPAPTPIATPAPVAAGPSASPPRRRTPSAPSPAPTSPRPPVATVGTAAPTVPPTVARTAPPAPTAPATAPTEPAAPATAAPTTAAPHAPATGGSSVAPAPGQDDNGDAGNGAGDD